MEIYYSNHWQYKKNIRKITDDLIEYAVQNSNIIKDKIWEDAFNAVSRLPNGRTIKVVYKTAGKGKIKIITAFWTD